MASKLRTTSILGFSSAFGLGYIPVGPGTFGTLAAIPIWWWLARYELAIAIAVTLAIVGFSIWISELAERIYGTHDVGKIVIDEVAGMLVTVVGVPARWPEIVAAFILFRVLDITKPPPIRWLDKHVQGGLGVVLDDVVAGVVGCAILHAARFVHGGWW